MNWFCKHKWKIIFEAKCPGNKYHFPKITALLACRKCGKLSEKTLAGNYSTK